MNLQVLKSCATKLPKPLILLFTALTYYPTCSWTTEDAFSVRDLSYDFNGNILGLTRNNAAGTGLDVLDYNYEQAGRMSNQLMSVSDAGDKEEGFIDGNTTGHDYQYDGNGNMISDLNKDITSITYNHLNLPQRVNKADGHYLTYVYDAAGIKLSQHTFTPGDVLEKQTDYIGSFIYENDQLQLIQHAEGRIVPKSPFEGGQGDVYDYQYHLKDHLGNVRLTFSTTPESYTIFEDFEDTSESPFKDLNVITNANKNTTAPYGSNDKLVQLTSGTTGAMIFLSMDKGDTIDMSVEANYWGAPTSNTFLGTAYSALFNSFDNVYGGGESGVISNSSEFDDALNGVDMGGKGNTSTAPRAFLNYIFFDRDMNYITAGFQQVSTAAKTTGANTYELISIDEIVADRNGYILAYLSNENSETFTVNFDDFTVVHSKTNVVSTQDYTPFGLTFNEYERTASTPNKWKYAGKEELDSWGVLDFGFRTYDPTTGRWNGIDALAENSISMTPYHYVNNNPIAYIDPNGLDWFYYAKDGESEASWNWHDGSTYDRTITYTDDDGNEQTETNTLQGVEAVVVFDGFTKENLGSKDSHSAGSSNKSNQYLNGNGTISANVTVYGPDGKDDISSYTGYTNSSDPSAFGVVENGIHDGIYVDPGKSGSLSSNWYVRGNSDGEVPARFGVNNAFPDRDYLTGVYIHSHNNDGFSGTYTSGNSYKGISQGCLLIARNQWADFNSQMSGVTNFKVQVRRTIHPVTAFQFMKMVLPKTDSDK